MRIKIYVLQNNCSTNGYCLNLVMCQWRKYCVRFTLNCSVCPRMISFKSDSTSVVPTFRFRIRSIFYVLDSISLFCINLERYLRKLGFLAVSFNVVSDLQDVSVVCYLFKLPIETLKIICI